MAGRIRFTPLRAAGLALVAAALIGGPAVFLAAGLDFESRDQAVRDDTGVTASAGLNDEQIPLELLGASGVLPKVKTLQPEMVASLAAPLGVTQLAGVSKGQASIPPVVMDAYRRTELVLAQRIPACGLRWPLLAGIGRVISDHARGGGLDPQGTTASPILGPRLDGTPGRAKIADTDDGRLDGDNAWDRAAGPMQIIPPVWQRLGADSNRDGVASPHSIYDAALVAGRFLCEGGADLREPTQQLWAAFRYQRSETFVRAVVLWARAYGAGLVPPATPVPLPVLPAPETVTLPGEPPPPGPLPAGPARGPASLAGSGSSTDGSTTIRDPSPNRTTTPEPSPTETTTPPTETTTPPTETTTPPTETTTPESSPSRTATPESSPIETTASFPPPEAAP